MDQRAAVGQRGFGTERHTRCDQARRRGRAAVYERWAAISPLRSCAAIAHLREARCEAVRREGLLIRVRCGVSRALRCPGGP